MGKLVSIIVPIYNVQKYLDKCVMSLIDQTYPNLEIILVDDGSNDQCSVIIDDFAQRDKRIVAIHKANGGLSDARNAGIKVANGDFISFIDSDDFVSIDFIEMLYNALNDNQSDIAECDVVKFNEGEKPKIIDLNKKAETFDNYEGMKMFLFSNMFNQTVWNKLYRKEVIQDIFFEEGKTNEDEYWTYQVFARAKKVTRIYEQMYYYLQRQGSIMGTGYNIKRLDCIEALENKYEFVKENYPDFEKEEQINLCEAYLYHYQILYRTKDFPNKEQHLKELHNRYCKLYDEKIFYNKSDKEQKWNRMFSKHPKRTSKIRNILRIGL